MITIELCGKIFPFPEKWEELTPDQLTRVCGFLLEPWTPSLQYTLIRLLTPDVEPELWTRLTDEELGFLLPITDFLQKPILPGEMRLFRIGGRGFWLPSRLKVRAVDWVVSEPLLKAFSKNGSQEYLDALVATVCRPRKLWISFFGLFKVFALNWDGDPREKYHSEISTIRAKRLGKVPIHIKLMVVWWLVQLRWQIFKDYKSVFSGGSGDGDWTECIMDLSEKQLFGDFQETMQTNLHLILKYLHKEKKRYKQTKR
jgi:hypothetical protein